MFEKICIIILANFLFFWKTLCYKYSSDDIPVFNNPPFTRSKMQRLFFWIEGRLRISPEKDHFLTMIIHAMVCVCIYLGFGKNDISYIAALLFTVNPANNQGSVWISGRSYVLAALGMTGALAFPFVGVMFLYLAASTNPGFVAPLVILGTKHFGLMMALPLIWFFHWKRFKGNVKFKMEKEMFKEDKEFKIEKFIVATKTFGFYTLLALIPFKNTFYHSFLQSMAGSGKEKAYSIKDRFFWFGLLVIAGIGTYWIMVPWNIISFALLWWCVCMAPFLNFFRMSQEIAERYMYLPNCGLMIVLASTLVHYPIAVSAFLTMYAVRMWFYMDSYEDDYYLLENSCLNSPQSWFAWHVRGMKRWENNSHHEAVVLWAMARLLSPKEFKVNFNIASALKGSGRLKEAEEYMKIAMENVPLGQEDDAAKLFADWKSGRGPITL